MSEAQAKKLASGALVSAEYLAHTRTFLPEQADNDFWLACGRSLRVSIRVNTLKCSIEAFHQIATRYHWELENIPWCKEGFWLKSVDTEASLSLGNTPEHIQGLFYIQEASSMLPPIALLNSLTESEPLVVDMAAAPGSKTTQIAAMLENKGIILANELSASRLKSLHSNLVRCGILNVSLSHLDACQLGDLMPGQFDYVLLDAPCGGEGTVRKDINALSGWRLNQINEMAKLQKTMILSAYKALKPGGVLVYSTCTLSKEENHQVGDFLAEETNAEILSLKDLFAGAEEAITPQGYLHVLPHLFDSEGFFVAKFRKPQETVIDELPVAKYDSPFLPVTRKFKQQVLDYYQNHFGLSILPDGYQLLQRDKEIWLFPQNIESINQYIKVNRAGLQVAQVYPNKVKSTHQMASCLGGEAKYQKLDLNSEQASRFIQGNNIEADCNDIRSGEVLLRYQGHIIGIGQNQKGKIKNGLPRELVRDNLKF